MIERRLYRFSAIPEIEKFCLNEEVLCCAVSRFNDDYYMYIELVDSESAVFDGLEQCERISEIFSYCPVQKKDEWIKGRIKPEAIFKFARLKPEKVDSYIKYHDGLRRGKKGARPKFYSIFLDRTTLINFDEKPMVLANPDSSDMTIYPYTEVKNWTKLMLKHFVNEEDWVDGELVFNYFK